MQVSDQIIAVLDNLCEKFGLAIDWTSETILPYATTLLTKLVSYEIWTSVAYIIFAVLGTIACIVIIKQSIAHFDDLDIFAIMAITLCVGVGGVAVVKIGTEIMDIIKCVTFPELFVFEYIQNLINSGT